MLEILIEMKILLLEYFNVGDVSLFDIKWEKMLGRILKEVRRVPCSKSVFAVTLA